MSTQVEYIIQNTKIEKVSGHIIISLAVVQIIISLAVVQIILRREGGPLPQICAKSAPALPQGLPQVWRRVCHRVNIYIFYASILSGMRDLRSIVSNESPMSILA